MDDLVAIEQSHLQRVIGGGLPKVPPVVKEQAVKWGKRAFWGLAGYAMMPQGIQDWFSKHVLRMKDDTKEAPPAPPDIEG